MSDGPSDCARTAEHKARGFASRKYRGVPIVERLSEVKPGGNCVYIYEEWLTHIVELVRDEFVVERWAIEPFRRARKVPLKYDIQPGYYRDRRLRR